LSAATRPRAGASAAPAWASGAARLLLALMAGSLWITGYVVAPTLFTMLDRTLAGEVAGQLFTWVAWIVIGAAGALLALERGLLRHAGPWVATGIVVVLAIALAGLFGIRPRIAALKAAQQAGRIAADEFRTDFGLWHALSSTLFLLQSVLAAALVVVWRR
jgi:Domain of unknown function (DUF4149)